MIFWSLQITIISIIMIFLVHHLILFFKSTLTVPKIKDLINAPAQKYENIYNILSQGSQSDITNSNDGTTKLSELDINQETKNEINSMKNELKSFLKKQLKGDNLSGGSSNISTLDSFTSLNIQPYV
jgi:hypothetical protein